MYYLYSTTKAREACKKDIKTRTKGTLRVDARYMKGNGRKLKDAGSQAKTAGQNAKKAKLPYQQGKKLAQRTRQTAQDTVKAAGQAGKAIKASVKAAVTSAKALGTVVAAGGWLAALTIIIVGVIGGALFFGSSSNKGNEPLSQEVLDYVPLIQKYANQYGIPEYAAVIQAIMMQESGGRGTDPMQCSQCPYNTEYPDGITDPEYSIQAGIQYYADCVETAECQGPSDLDKLKLSLQGYNYGNGYISWAVENYGGYSEANALLFSQEQAAAHGRTGYGDPEYVPHVLRYYSGGNFFSGLFGMIGNGQIVEVARSQLGNAGGQPYWEWYGFSSRVSWCACFVSWCGDQCGYIESGAMPKFSYCPTGIQLFQEMGQWQEAGYIPKPGDIIFFDRQSDGISDHVGIVEKCEDGIVYTIEGNSGDMCKQRDYAIDNETICGYGVMDY